VPTFAKSWADRLAVIPTVATRVSDCISLLIPGSILYSVVLFSRESARSEQTFE